MSDTSTEVSPNGVRPAGTPVFFDKTFVNRSTNATDIQPAGQH